MSAQALAVPVTGLESRVLVAIKTPFMLRPISALLPADISIEGSVQALRDRVDPFDEDARRVLAQLAREMSGTAFHYLVVQPHGAMAAAAGSALLRDISAPREVRTTKGLQTIPVVAIEIQAYAPVGA